MDPRGECNATCIIPHPQACCPQLSGLGCTSGACLPEEATMFTRRLAAGVVLLLACGGAAGQTGLQLLTVFPPGAKAGATVEVTVSGVGLDGDEKLLFSGKGFEAERAGTATPDPKTKQPGQPGQATSAVKFKVTAP